MTEVQPLYLVLGVWSTSTTYTDFYASLWITIKSSILSWKSRLRPVVIICVRMSVQIRRFCNVASSQKHTRSHHDLRRVISYSSQLIQPRPKRPSSTSIRRAVQDVSRHGGKSSQSSSKDPIVKFMHAVDDTSLHPYEYTSGRWLKNDRLQRESRRTNFDFLALCDKAVELCPGASSVVSIQKEEGGFNRVFIFSMNNSQRIVARIPTPIAGPQRLTTNSEVATIAYSESCASYPFPCEVPANDLVSP